MEKKWIIFFLLDIFLDGALVSGDLVYLSDLGTFMIIVSIYFTFSETLDGIRPRTSFSTLEIFLIFIKFFFLEVTYPMSISLLTQPKKTSKNDSLMTLKEAILENKQILLVKNVYFVGV